MELELTGGVDVLDLCSPQIVMKSQLFDRVVVLCGCDFGAVSDGQIVGILDHFRYLITPEKFRFCAFFQKKNVNPVRIMTLNKKIQLRYPGCYISSHPVKRRHFLDTDPGHLSPINGYVNLALLLARILTVLY